MNGPQFSFVPVLFFLVLNAHAQDVPDLSYCQTVPVRSDALDFPSKHAWDLFVTLNQPAIDENIRRGVPDCSRKIGAAGSTAVWETWRNGETEVFTAIEPPEWNDTSLKDEKPGAVPKEENLKALSAREFLFSNAPFHDFRPFGGATVLFSPTDGVFDIETGGGFGETRINKVTYEFIRDECLYNRQGLVRYAAALETGKKPPIRLPPDSIEVKAAWIDFEQEKTPMSDRASFYTADWDGKKYGLVALHILTKDTPNWFWATFHHKTTPDNLDNEIPDTYGQPSVLNGTVWANYELGGTQTDFVTAEGEASKLSDHYVEFGFQKSSCITCHATATISAKGNSIPAGQGKAICLLDPTSEFIGAKETKDVCTNVLKLPARLYDTAPDGTLSLIEERGAPLPEWFLENGKKVYHQTDFLWSIPLRAGRVSEIGEPPARCKW